MSPRTSVLSKPLQPSDTDPLKPSSHKAMSTQAERRQVNAALGAVLKMACSLSMLHSLQGLEWRSWGPSAWGLKLAHSVRNLGLPRGLNKMEPV